MGRGIGRIPLFGGSGQQDAGDVRAILGVDDGERHALRGPYAKLPEGDVSTVRRVIEAAASIGLTRIDWDFDAGFTVRPFPPCSTATVAWA
jgi:hypothetical protein